jgi:HSP20 family protein
MPRLRGVNAVISISHDIDDLFERFFGSGETNAVWEPLADVFASEATVHIQVELPGVAGRDTHIRVGTRSVQILGVKRVPAQVRRGMSFYESQIPYGAFEKRISLPFSVDPDSFRARLRDGVLSLELSRVQSGAKVVVID